MSYPDYYVQACEILRCRPEASFSSKQARFHRMMEQWQHDCYFCMNRQGQQPRLSEERLAELQWAMAVIWESERSFEPRPEPSDWRDRLWQNLPMGQLIPEFSLGDEFAFWIPPAFADGIMHPVYRDYSIVAVDIDAEEEIWSFTANGRITSPVVDQGVVVFRSTDRHVYALDASTTEEIWRFRTTAQVRFPPSTNCLLSWCPTAETERQFRVTWLQQIEGDLTRPAMSRLDREFRHENMLARIVMMNHDAVWVEAQHSETDQVQRFVRRIND